MTEKTTNEEVDPMTQLFLLMGVFAIIIAAFIAGFISGKDPCLVELKAVQNTVIEKDAEIDSLKAAAEVSKVQDCDERRAISYVIDLLASANRADLDKIFGVDGFTHEDSLVYFVDDEGLYSVLAAEPTLRNIRFVSNSEDLCGSWGFDSILITADNDH